MDENIIRLAQIHSPSKKPEVKEGKKITYQIKKPIF